MDAGSQHTASPRRSLRGLLSGMSSPRRRGATLGWLASIVMLGLGAVLAAAESPLWWFGGTLLLTGASLVLRFSAPARQRWAEQLGRPRRWLGITVVPLALCAELACLTIIVGVGLVMMRDSLGGERPVSHDHTVHYVKAWLLHQKFLPHGRLYGWSNSWFAGYPVSYLYPPGADLWVNAMYALGFGALSFSQAYAFAFVLFHVFTGLSVYRFGRVVGGRSVGLIAALLSLTDIAFFRMGGWNYTMEWGVWPQTLSLAFSLMALCSMPAVVEQRRLAPIGAFAIWMGLAIISHPMQLVFLGLLIVSAVLASIFADGVRSASALFRILLSSALGLLVASLWLIPFLSSRAETSSMGVWWDTTYEIGKSLLELTVFPGTLGYVVGFGILGALAMLRTRRFPLLFVALSGLLIPAVTNSTFVDELHLTTLSPALAKIQFVRLSIMVKPFWFVLAGFAAVGVARLGERVLAAVPGLAPEQGAAARPRSALQQAMFVAVIGILTIPFAVPAAQAFWAKHVRKSLTTESERAYGYDRVQLEQWLLNEMPHDGFFRVGVFTGHNHDLMDLGAVLDRPIYKRGFTPVSNFIYQMNTRDVTTLEAVNLRFAISKLPLPAETFERVANFGIYDVYRFKRWDPRPFQILEGEGDVGVERFDDEEVVLNVAPGAHGKLRLNVSYFSRWHVYRDGKPVTMTLTYLRGQPDTTGFMTVPMVPGRYRFVFEPTLGDRIAIPLGLLGFALCLGLVLADGTLLRLGWLRSALATTHRGLDALSGPAFRGRRQLLAAAIAAATLACGIALARWQPPLQVQGFSPVDVRRVRYDFLERLSQARVSLGFGGFLQPCVAQGDRHVCRNGSGELDIDNYVASSPATLKDYILTRCIRARPVQDGVLGIEYPDVPLGQRLLGYFGIERAGRLMFKRRPVDFKVTIDGEAKYQGHTQNDNKIHWFDVPVGDLGKPRANVTFSVEAANISKRYFCFHAQMVDPR